MFYQLQQWGAELSYGANKLYMTTQITFCDPVEQVKEMEERQGYSIE